MAQVSRSGGLSADDVLGGVHRLGRRHGRRLTGTAVEDAALSGAVEGTGHALADGLTDCDVAQDGEDVLLAEDRRTVLRALVGDGAVHDDVVLALREAVDHEDEWLLQSSRGDLGQSRELRTDLSSGQDGQTSRQVVVGVCHGSKPFVLGTREVVWVSSRRTDV